MNKLGLFYVLYLTAIISVGYRQNAILVKTDPLDIRRDFEKNEQLDFKFEDLTQSLFPLHRSFNDKGKKNDFKFKAPSFKSGISRSYVAAVDYNQDGFVDIVYLTMQTAQDDNIVFLKNVNGSRYEIEKPLAPKYARECYPSAIQFIDYNNDGWPDLFLGCTVGNFILLKNDQGVFKDVSEETGINKFYGFSANIAVFDMNRDGFLDLYISSYVSPDEKIEKGTPDHSFPPPYADSGAQNRLLINHGGQSFTDETIDKKAEDTGYTWVTGVSDINGDGWPDLYIANDFGFDRLLLNQQGKYFEDVSKSALGLIKAKHSMSAEIADYNNDGLPDIYVTNSPKYSEKGWNSLWTNTGQVDKPVEDMAYSKKVDRCGLSWGAKFIDLNRDGLLDLVVVNGMQGTSTDDSWYNLLWIGSTPREIFHYLPIEGVGVVPRNYAGSQQGCVYLQKLDGTFTDVAIASGFIENANNRGLALIDFDNNGTLDLAISNKDQDPFFFKNIYLGKSEWIGFELIGTKSNRSAIGAKIILKTNKATYTKENYPTNGFSSLNDMRMVFAILPEEKILKLEILWPTGAKQIVKEFVKNKYVKIMETTE